MDANYLNTIAADLLDSALDGLDITRTGIEPPARQYRAHSRPAVDICTETEGRGQISVYLDPSRALTFATSPASTPGRATSAAVPHMQLVAPIATFVVEWWRCHPAFAIGGQIPSADDLDDAATLLGRDLWCVTQQFLAEWKAGTLISVGCRSIDIAAVSVLGPQGGAAGWTVSVRAGCSDPP